jgi:hypothetical protein
VLSLAAQGSSGTHHLPLLVAERIHGLPQCHFIYVAMGARVSLPKI